MIDIEKLIKLYRNGSSSYKIALIVGYSATTVRYHLAKNGIKLRSKSESIRGVNNGNWKGGVHKDGYTYDYSPCCPDGRKLRRKVLNNCNHCCVICYKKYESGAGKFAIHHIDLDKANNEIKNLELLCNGCHQKVHKSKSFKREAVKGE